MQQYVKPLKFGTGLAYKLLVQKEYNTKTARWIKDQLTELGPAYIKIGQIVSSRQDIFPLYITEELSNLQDNVSQFSLDDTYKLFQEDMNEPLSNYVSTISTNPIAAASIGQVYVAKLKKSNKKVALKVQRPTIADTFEKDLQPVRDILQILKMVNNRTVNDILLVVNECSMSIKNELDFRNEYEKMKVFSKIFKDNDTFIIPRVYSKMSSKRLLAMEYLPGIKVTDTDTLRSKNIDTQSLAYTLMTTFVDTLLTYGYIHADPHPGNLSILPNGKIVLYDYGIIANIDIDLKNYLQKLINGFVSGDVPGIMNTIIEGKIIYPLESSAKNINELTDYEYVVLYKLITYILDYIMDLDLKKLNNKIESDDVINPNNVPYVFDKKMLLIFKTLSTLEGVCKTLDPEFNYNEILMEKFQSELQIDFQFLLNRLKRDIQSFNTSDIDKKIDQVKFKQLNDKIENNKTIYVLIMVYMLMSG